jgi:predicted glycoside hydrolase/deacetylase ChbG (UPF0249 family)
MWRSVRELRAHVVPEAAEIEMRAQLDAALSAGLDVTHIDAHMGAALAPELVDAYLRLGLEYMLPVLYPRHARAYLKSMNIEDVEMSLYEPRLDALEKSGMPAIDYFAMTPGVASHEVERTYKELFRRVPPGLSFLAFHCNAPGDIENIVPQRAQWRIDEFELFRSEQFRDWVAGQDLRLVGFREIRDRYRAWPSR